MRSLLKIIAAFSVACLVSASAFAAEASPAGTWKWTVPGRDGGPGFDQVVKLDLKDGLLTGTLLGGPGPGGNQMPDVAIGDASFKDGAVAFSVTREFNGNKRTTKYSGKLDGDTITGSSERQGRDGSMQKREWVATRAK
jgi:hypothetical protein